MAGHLRTVRDLPGLDTFRDTLELPAAFLTHYNAFLATYDRMIEFALGFERDDQRDPRSAHPGSHRRYQAGGGQ